MGVNHSLRSDMNSYVVHGKLGRGKYSHVLEGTDKRTNAKVAIKVLVPIRNEKIKREYQILSSLNHPHIAKLIEAVQCPYLRQTSFIEEYVPHVDFRKIYLTFSLNEIRLYMRQLFKVRPSPRRLCITSTQRVSCIGISNHWTCSSIPHIRCWK
jgi:serine/threonine protein kinase